VPAGRKSKLHAEPVDPAKLDIYRTNWTLAMRELIRIRPRDKTAGTKGIVPFELRPAQEKAFRDIQLLRSLNILKSLRNEYPDDWQAALRSVLRTSALPNTYWDLTHAILEARPEYVLHHLKDDYPLVSDAPILIIIVKARQVGFSTLIQVILFLIALFNERTSVMITSCDDESAENVLNMTTTIVEEWPTEHEALRPEFPGEARNRLEFDNKSTYLCRTSDGKQIRGFIHDANHLTEYAHYKYLDRIASAVSAAPAHATIVIESTAAGPSGDYYEKAQNSTNIQRLIRAYDNDEAVMEAQFIKIFVSWLEDPRYRTRILPADVREGGPYHKDSLTDAEKRLLLKYTPGRLDSDGFPLPSCTLENIKWRRERIKNHCQNGKDRDGARLTPEQYFMQEYPADEEEAFQQASGAVFESEPIMAQEAIALVKKPAFFRIRDERGLPERVDHEHLANLKIWTPPRKGHLYTAGVDIGRGVGRDNSVIHISDRLDGTVGEQVAEFAYNLLNEVSFAHIAVMLCRMYNDAFMVPENNASVGFINAVTQAIKYTKLFMEQSQDKVGGSSTPTMTYGYYTKTQAKKDTFLQQLRDDIRLGNYRIYSSSTLDEMRTYKFDDPDNPRSATNARSGCKDDRVIAAALANLGRYPRFGAPTMGVQVPTADRPNADPTGGPPPAPDYLSAVERALMAASDAGAPSGKKPSRRLDWKDPFAVLN
jgi:hypothetical protein